MSGRPPNGNNAPARPNQPPLARAPGLGERTQWTSLHSETRLGSLRVRRPIAPATAPLRHDFMRRLLRQITVRPRPRNRPSVAAAAARKSLIAQSNPIVKGCLGIIDASQRWPLMAALFGRAPKFFADNGDADSLLPVARGVGQQASTRASHAVCWKFSPGMGLFCPVAPLQAHGAHCGCRGCNRRISRRGRRHLAA